MQRKEKKRSFALQPPTQTMIIKCETSASKSKTVWNGNMKAGFTGFKATRTKKNKDHGKSPKIIKRLIMEDGEQIVGLFMDDRKWRCPSTPVRSVPPLSCGCRQKPLTLQLSLLFWKPCEEKRNDKKRQQHCQWRPEWRRWVQAEPARSVWAAGKPETSDVASYRCIWLFPPAAPSPVSAAAPSSWNLWGGEKDPLSSAAAASHTHWHQAARSFTARTSIFSSARVDFSL